MHIDDLRKFAILWLHKTEEVRTDTAHYGKNITGDIYEIHSTNLVGLVKCMVILLVQQS
ncbi:hypothetical protein HanIR_Chr13g0659351 [Helianthus annuus]|nr:hypothetical protein HanIR_Chr13g0659351 [Helianthus annuus]